MNLQCDTKVLQDVRELIRDVILPRLTLLEEEVRMLRAVTWPVCQSLRETSQLTDIENKKRFFSILDDDEMNNLLHEKASVSARYLGFSTVPFVREEMATLRTYSSPDRQMSI
jgi:hypothetical protein